ncbi:uncharacterized protein G6M90_00g016470 [Metarhizium brunneum]|uniref:Uncharacterized protein n=1 Tax=Metarhizium brunneum TaxID=500148 RepID=A0A7D5YTC3_9HYPO|nr:hypothetical protein G6M90_00g016470 [Metarhizium brunneum]
MKLINDLLCHLAPILDEQLIAKLSTNQVNIVAYLRGPWGLVQMARIAAAVKYTAGGINYNRLLRLPSMTGTSRVQMRAHLEALLKVEEINGVKIFLKRVALIQWYMSTLPYRSESGQLSDPELIKHLAVNSSVKKVRNAIESGKGLYNILGGHVPNPT